MTNFVDNCKSTTYTGIGSRQTHPDILALMTRIAAYLDRKFWMLRSGGAEGADRAFESGASRSELYLPWSGFGSDTCGGMRVSELRKIMYEPSSKAYEIAARYHPAWMLLKESVRRLHSRNVHQVLGAHCDDPSAFVVCWTPDGSTGETNPRTGGTGQALRIAKAHGIPIFNLQREDHRAVWEKLVS